MNPIMTTITPTPSASSSSRVPGRRRQKQLSTLEGMFDEMHPAPVVQAEVMQVAIPIYEEQDDEEPCDIPQFIFITPMMDDFMLDHEEPQDDEEESFVPRMVKMDTSPIKEHPLFTSAIPKPSSISFHKRYASAPASVMMQVFATKAVAANTVSASPAA